MQAERDMLAKEIERVTPLLPPLRDFALTTEENGGKHSELLVCRFRPADAALWFAEQLVVACRGAREVIWFETPQIVQKCKRHRGQTIVHWHARARFVLVP